MTWFDDETDECHCGKLVMACDPDILPSIVEHYGRSLYEGYCRDCADCRCDTSAGMEAGCPNK